MKGTLYVVGTPIGNLKDITLRAIDILREVDFIVAENRTHSLKLLSNLGISKHIITINSYNEDRKAKEVAGYILEGKNCALITSAGTPCISDPGARIVRLCHESDIDVRVVPGPSAPVSALSISGIFADKFLFYGFLPQKKGKKMKVFKEISTMPYASVFFESPRRLMETLNCIRDGFGERFVVVLKEMTKVYEDVKRGYVSELIEYFGQQDIKGEYVIIVHGREKQG